MTEEVRYGRKDVNITICRKATLAEVREAAPELLPGWMRLGVRIEPDEPAGGYIAVFVDMIAFTNPDQLLPFAHLVPKVG